MRARLWQVGRTYELGAASDADRRKWAEALMQVTTHAPALACARVYVSGAPPGIGPLASRGRVGRKPLHICRGEGLTVLDQFTRLDKLREAHSPPPQQSAPSSPQPTPSARAHTRKQRGQTATATRGQVANGRAGPEPGPGTGSDAGVSTEFGYGRIEGLLYKVRARRGGVPTAVSLVCVRVSGDRHIDTHTDTHTDRPTDRDRDRDRDEKR